MPVVAGPSKDYYLEVLPPGSFIHIEDFKDPEELSNFLVEVGRDQKRYEEYFQWKEDVNSIYFQVLRKATGTCDMLQQLRDGQLNGTRKTDIVEAYQESYQTCKAKI